MHEGQIQSPADINMANRFVWHAMQPFYRQTSRQKVQPQIRFAEPPMELPIEFESFADGTFPDDGYDVWAYADERAFYGGSPLEINLKEYAIQVADVHPEGYPAPDGYSRLPQSVIALSALSALFFGRPDLDDNERRFLRETQYFFWRDRGAVRQDVFQVDSERHIVPVIPQAAEIKRLHDIAFCSSFCACGVGVMRNHYAPLNMDATVDPLARKP